MWQLEGSCTSQDPELFDSTRGLDAVAAAAVCLRCPVIDLCYDTASKEDKRWTVRGGNLPASHAGSHHGTVSGVQRHAREGTRECDACRQARRVTEAAKRARSRARKRRKK